MKTHEYIDLEADRMTPDQRRGYLLMQQEIMAVRAVNFAIAHDVDVSSYVFTEDLSPPRLTLLCRYEKSGSDQGMRKLAFDHINLKRLDVFSETHRRYVKYLYEQVEGQGDGQDSAG